MARAEPVGGAVPAGSIRVSIACSVHDGQAVEVTIAVADSSTVLDAIRASGLLERFPAIDVSTRAVGVWGRPCALASPVRDGDRIEIYRPLVIDPKEARRQRAGSAGGSPSRRLGTTRR